VVPKPEETLLENDVKRVCKALLETYMVPAHVLVVDALPRTARGKLSRKLVAEHFEGQLLALTRPRSMPEVRP
jgi:acyl-CoA synthetase (AMP-forming)/AMP-acid ligase II